MGRPKLYNTPEERNEAKRVNRRSYYARNKSAISSMRKEKYHARQAIRHNDAGVLPCNSSTIEQDGILPTGTEPTKKKPRCSKRDRMTVYLGGEPYDIINGLLLEYLEMKSSEKLRAAVGVIEEIFLETRQAETDLLMQGVVGKRYAKASLATKNVKDVLSALEDVLCDVLVDGMDLQRKYDNNEFLFQQLWQ